MGFLDWLNPWAIRADRRSKRELAMTEQRDDAQRGSIVGAAGYWTIKGDTGLTMIIFDSEDAANRMHEQVKSAVPDAMTLEDVEVREVAAHA